MRAGAGWLAALVCGLSAQAMAQDTPDEALPPDEVIEEPAPASEALDDLFRELDGPSSPPATDPGQLAAPDIDTGAVVAPVGPVPGEDVVGQDAGAQNAGGLLPADEPVAAEEPGLITPRDAYVKRSGAVLRGLDKITGRFTDFTVRADEPAVFGSLEVTLSACYDTPPDLPPEAGAFLKIRSQKPIAPESMSAELADRLAGKDPKSDEVQRPEVFSGWMFASSPGLNALEHPVYDVWVIRCSAD